jgi:hypothetical protein
MEMSKSNVPRSFGVFKPIGHTVICIKSAELVKIALEAFRDRGFPESSLTQYSPQEMMTQVDADILSASPLTEFGQEVNIIKAHYELAKNGCSFVVVYAPEDEQANIVDSVISVIKPVMAQRYGRFLIEELVSSPSGQHQVPESMETGLDTKSLERK